MDAPVPREAIEQLDATVQRVLRERYDNVIPLVAEPKRRSLRRIAPRTALRSTAFRFAAGDRPAA